MDYIPLIHIFSHGQVKLFSIFLVSTNSIQTEMVQLPSPIGFWSNDWQRSPSAYERCTPRGRGVAGNTLTYDLSGAFKKWMLP